MIIFNKKDVITALNRENAEIYIGEKGYYCYRMHDWMPCELLKVNFDEDYDVRNVFSILDHKTEHECPMFLPADKVKEVEEKKYRPFKSTDEFLKFYKVGQVIHIKNKSDNLEQLTSIVAIFIRCYCCVCLGTNNNALPFEDLFKKYEIEINGKWQPFGVEE